MSYTAMLTELRESEREVLKMKEATWEATTDEAVKFYEECYQRQKKRAAAISEEIELVKEKKTRFV